MRYPGANRFPANRRAEGGRGGNRRFQPQPEGPSASLLAHPLVRGGSRSAGPNLGEAILLGVPLLYPEIAVERLETLAEARFAAAELAALAAALAAEIAENPGISAEDLQTALERAGHASALGMVSDKLRSAGLGGLAGAGAERGAAIWDDAAHLRLRAGALSIERQAAAAALGQEASDVNLGRLRDIQEQVSRSLRPEQRDETEEAVIVHPFKRR
jgi:DNA primase